MFPTRNIKHIYIQDTFNSHVKITRRVNQPELIQRGWRLITINTFRAMAISMCTDLNPEKKQTTRDRFGEEIVVIVSFLRKQVPFDWKEVVWIF